MRNNSLVFILMGIVFVTILLSPLVLGGLGTFKQNSNIDLIQICSNDTSLCDSCNITSVISPNSTLLLEDKVMTKRQADFNYTFKSTSELGRYNVFGFCQSGDQFKVWSYTFDVTTTGGETNSIVILIFLFIGGFLLLVIGFYYDSVSLIFISGSLFVVAGVFTMIYGFGDFSDVYTRAISYVSIGIGIIFTLASVYEGVWNSDSDD